MANQWLKGISLIFIFLASLAANVEAQTLSSSESLSKKFNYLDQSSAERISLVRGANIELNDYLGRSSNHEGIRQYLSSIYNKGSAGLIGRIDADSYLLIERRGFRGDRLIKVKGGRAEVLFSTKGREWGANTRIYSATLSPSAKHISILLSQEGAITNYDLVFYDMTTQRLGEAFKVLGGYAGWLSDSIFVALSNFEYQWLLYDTGRQESALVSHQNFMELTGMVASPPTPAAAAATILQNPKEIISEILFVTSFDGARVPLVVQRMQGTIKNGNLPVLIKAYGGFGVHFLERAILDTMEQNFIRSGGVVISAGLRGGSELGNEWHRAAQGPTKKIKTYEDLAATAEYLVKEGWTKASRIVSTGTSNGGLTVAATALLFPDRFGLVIPVAGVLDLSAYNTLDSTYFPNWKQDYGDPQVPADLEAILGISPVELVARQSKTKFLVITGDDDDRVNPAHSIKFFQALEEQGGSPENVYLACIDHTGHASVAPLGGSPEWLATNRYWTMIYDHLEMKFVSHF